MPVQVPHVRAYAFNRRPRLHLTCWLPPTEIRRLADTGRAEPALVWAFPDGVEIKVTPEATSWTIDRYTIRMEPAPSLVWLAFQYLQHHVPALPLAGYLHAEFLDELASRMQPNAQAQPDLPERLRTTGILHLDGPEPFATVCARISAR